MRTLRNFPNIKNIICRTQKTIPKKPFRRSNHLLTINDNSDESIYKNFNFILFKQNLKRQSNESKNLNKKIDGENLNILIKNTSSNSIKCKSPLHTISSYSNPSTSTRRIKKKYSNSNFKNYLPSDIYITDVLLYNTGNKLNRDNSENKIKLKNNQQFAFISNKQKKYFINNCKKAENSKLKICQTMCNFHRPKTCKKKKFDQKFLKLLKIEEKNEKINIKAIMINEKKEFLSYRNKDKLFSEKFMEEKYKVNMALKKFDKHLLQSFYFTELFKKKSKKLYKNKMTSFKVVPYKDNV